jgi:triosephosphate isomerase (TIM)
MNPFGPLAPAQQAQDMHEFIREQIMGQYGMNVAENTSILYGGSVKGSNAKEIFAGADVDGALVGGASLDVEDFLRIAGGFQ